MPLDLPLDDVPRDLTLDDVPLDLVDEPDLLTVDLVFPVFLVLVIFPAFP